MKKRFTLIFYLTMPAVILLLSVTHVNKIREKALAIKGESVSGKPGAAQLNGSPAFFQTYEDFVNSTGKPWKEVSSDEVPTFNNQIAKIVIVFKDESGKKIKKSPEDFWGWRDSDGGLYRNGDFVNGKITKYPFMLRVVTTDYIEYTPITMNTVNMTVVPYEWISENIESPIMGNDVYFKHHDKTVFNKVNKLISDAFHKHGQMISDKEMKKENEDAYKSVEQVICYYHSTSMKTGSYIK